MADPLDFGKFAQTAIAFQNLQETVRRNDSYEQNVAINLKQAQADLERAKRQQFRDLFELSKDPRVMMNPVLNDQALSQAWKAAGLADVSPEFFAASRDKTRGVMQAMTDGDPDLARDAFIDLQILAGPDDAKKIHDSMAGFQKMREYTENVETLRESQRARTDKIRGSMAKVNAGAIPYQQGVRDFIAALDGTDSKEFERGLKVTSALSASKKPSDDTAFSSLMGPASKSVESFVSPEMGVRADESAKKAAAYGSKLQELKKSLELVEAGEQPPNGKSKRDLIEQIAVGERMVDAYSTLAEWQRKPFDRTLLKKAQEAKVLMIQEKKNLEVTHAGASDELIKLRQDALTFRQTEAGKKDTYEKNVGKAQSELLDRYGYTPEDWQLSKIADKYGVKPSDILSGLSDPSKKGKLQVGLVKMGQEDLSRQFKSIEAAQGVLDYAADLRERIQKNPAIIGRGAQLGTALAGAGQQLRAIARMDPVGAKFLNTKPRDEAEAFHETLVYLQARSMDASGALDLKVVENARKVIGDLSTFTTGPQQILNKLQVVQANAERTIRRARQRLKGGPESYHTDPAGDKKVSEMSDEELLQTILGGGQ
jgi:hypothetical protein